MDAREGCCFAFFFGFSSLATAAVIGAGGTYAVFFLEGELAAAAAAEGDFFVDGDTGAAGLVSGSLLLVSSCFTPVC